MQNDYVGTIKKFGNYYKLTVTRSKSPLKKMYEPFSKKTLTDDEDQKKHAERFENNISRAKSTILELSLCNSWDYFVTFTIDQKKYNRQNLSLYYTKFSQFVRDYRKKTDCSVKYILVPEMHKDLKSYHLHGLMTDMLKTDIVKHTNKRNAKKGYNEFLPYTQKFGFNTFSKIKDPLACSLYMQKYITKDLGAADILKGSKLFYSSQKLNRAELIKESRITKPIGTLAFDYQNDYVSSVFSSSVELLQNYF